MSSPPSFPSAQAQATLIDANVNADLFDILLLGIYTSVYIATMYIYLSSKKSRSLFVLSSITVLYMINVGQTGIIWFLIKSLVGLAGQPESAFFVFSFVSANWIILTSQIFFFILIAVADGLLIWRCYHVWDGSIRVISPSLVLIAIEIGLDITQIVWVSVVKLRPSVALAPILNKLFGASSFISSGNTIITTILIVYRIRIVSQASSLKMGYKKRFITILDLIVQSSAVYVLASFTVAVLAVIPLDSISLLGNTLHLAVAQYYTNTLFGITAGLAPTIMVARVVMASEAPPTGSTTAHISDLEFQGPDSHEAAVGSDSQHSEKNI